VKAHIKKDRTESRLTYAEKEGVERSEERGNSGRVIGERGTKRKEAGWGGEGKGGGGEERSRGRKTGAQRGRGARKSKRETCGKKGSLFIWVWF